VPFAAGEFAPLNRTGDQVGARWADGTVTMPPGFKQAYQAYVEGGWGTLAGPVEHGGQGLPFTLATVVMEDLGSANMAFSLCMMLTPGAVESLKHHGSPELQRTWLPKLISGEWNGTMNLTEPQAGSDVGALRTQATPRGDGTYLVKGTKIYITFGEHDLTDNIVHLVLARLPDAPPGTKGISLFLVPKFRLGADGAPTDPNDVRCVSIEHKLGIHASPTCVLSFGDNDDCVGWLIGGEGGGMRAMFTMMNNARLNVGLQGVSIAERATQAAVTYAASRVQGVRAGWARRDAVPIIQHPDVRRMLLRMKALTQAARALTYYAAGQTDRATLGDRDAQNLADLLTPLVKAYGTDIGVEVASLGRAGPWRHGLCGGNRRCPALSRRPDRADLRGHERHPGRGSGRAQAGPGGRCGGADAAGQDQGRRPRRGRLACPGRGLRSRCGSSGGIRCRGPARRLLSVPDDAGDGDMRLADAAPACRARAGRGRAGFPAMKVAAARFYLDQVVPEAMGLQAAAVAPAALLYSVSEDAFAA
jgi:alkylation response protein AidB-like acyl-CoA dehydrogenase